jgi:alpha-mannosidase
LLWTLRAGSTRLEARLDAEWHGSEERLQWVMPVNVLARDALCGIQFGHVRRARHQNTSWDEARFEVCAHRYVYISEPGCGVGVLADGPRGYDVRDHTLALTLLRAPRFPDPACDLGPQTIEWSLYLDSGSQEIGLLEGEAARMAHPLRFVEHPVPVQSVPVVVDSDGVMVSTIKLAEDGSGDLVVRLWECRGARSSGTMRLAGRVLSIARCNALEEVDQGSDSETSWKHDSKGPIQVDLDFSPFEIRTYRIKFAAK